MILNVYNENCEVLKRIKLPDLEYISGRTSYNSKSNLYYKGAGCFYKSHFSLEEKYNVIKHTDISYIGYEVENEAWRNKFGIFTERYQPPFTDPIGGCGIKEENIIDNSKFFGLSAIEVKDVIKITNENKIYVLKYLNERKKFFDDTVDLKRIINLIGYMLDEDWNVPWDKNIYEDVDYYGRITDVADMFKSNKSIYKFGTVYAFMYGLYKRDKILCNIFCNFFGYSVKDLFSLPFVIFGILDKYNQNFEDILKPDMNTSDETYKYIINDVLLNGKCCASLGGEYFHNLAVEGYRKSFNG
jgi:hypothetical protein